MHFFIDESGSFIRNESGESAISCVGVLILPGRFVDEALTGFKTLSQDWPKSENGEVKGSKLDEAQIAQLCGFLIQFQAIFEVSVLDLNASEEVDVCAHRARTAEALTVGLTDEHRSELKQGVWQLRHQLEKIPLQLYAQTTALTDLVWRAFQHGQLFYCQRLPGELANYIWQIDAKEKKGPTSYEEWWRTCVMPLLQSRSLREPAKMLRGGNYSAYLRKFPLEAAPAYLEPHLPAGKKGKFHDLGSIFGNIKFQDSLIEPGIQIADVLTNAIRRGLSGRLQEKGWRAAGRLLIHSSRGAIVVNSFSSESKTLKRAYAPIVRELNKGGQNMIASRKKGKHIRAE